MDRNRLKLLKERKQIGSSSNHRQLLRRTGIGSAILLGTTGTAAAEDEADNYGNKNDHNLTMGSTVKSDGFEITIGWEWDPDDFGDTGQNDADINDGVGIIYDTRRWELEKPEYDTDNHCYWDGWHTPSSDYHAVSWQYDHEGDYFDDGLEYRQCSTLLSKKDGHDTYPVQGEYHHTWNDTSIKGLGVGTDSFYVRWENSGEEWTKKQSFNDVG